MKLLNVPRGGVLPPRAKRKVSTTAFMGDSVTNAPRPCCTSTSPRAAKMRTASRTTLRLTPNDSASSGSVGMVWPPSYRPVDDLVGDGVGEFLSKRSSLEGRAAERTRAIG